MTGRRWGWTLLLALGACPGGDDAGAPPEAVGTVPDSTPDEVPRYVSYAILRNGDTLAVERVLRAEGRLSSRVRRDSIGDLVIDAVTGPDGLVRSVTIESAGLPSPWPGEPATLHFEGERVLVRSAADSVASDTVRVASGTLPWVGTSTALVEQLITRARALGGDTLTVPVFGLVDRTAGEAVVTWESRTVATVRVGSEEPVRVTLDADGRVERMENVGAALTATRLR